MRWPAIPRAGPVAVTRSLDLGAFVTAFATIGAGSPRGPAGWAWKFRGPGSGCFGSTGVTGQTTGTFTEEALFFELVSAIFLLPWSSSTVAVLLSRPQFWAVTSVDAV